VGGSKYGGIERQGYDLSWTPVKVIEAEATINKVSGLIAVGVPPNQNDVVVASGNLIDPVSGTQVPHSAPTGSNILGSLGTYKMPLLAAGLGLLAIFGISAWERK
jgi:hypothetical protein